MRIKFNVLVKGLSCLAITSGSIYFSSSKLSLFQTIMAYENNDQVDFSKHYIDFRKKIIDKTMLDKVLNIVKNNPHIGHVMWNDKSNQFQNLKSKIEEQIIENNKKFRRHPNDFVLGVLSLHVYEDLNPSKNLTFKDEYLNKEYGEILNEWRIQEFKKEKGYYGAIYINEKNRQIVLVHRGTTFEISDFFKTNSPLKADINGIVKNKMTPYQNFAQELTKKSIEIANKNGYFLSITGHSMGAWLAELSTLYANQFFKYDKAKTVSFESPGSKRAFDKYISNVQNKMTEFDPRNFDMTSYLSAPNLINCCNSHYGKLIECEANIDELQKNIPDFIKSLSPFLARGIYSTLTGHSLKSILKGFDRKNGKPFKYKVVGDWPAISSGHLHQFSQKRKETRMKHLQ